MRAYIFTLVLTGVSAINRKVEDALYEAGCDDALLALVAGVPTLEFTREAESLPHAILSAVRDVGCSGLPVRVVRIEPDDLVNASEIARRSDRSREGIRLLVAGDRGPGGFPPPIANCTGASPLWSWAEVVAWFSDAALNGLDARALPDARFIAAANTALRLGALPLEPAGLDALSELLASVRSARDDSEIDAAARRAAGIVTGRSRPR